MLKPTLLSGLLPALVHATNFLNHTQLLAGVEDQAWFEANVPILDFPDSQIQQVYYYRWGTWREHLFYTGAQYGYLSTEFLQPVGYAGPYGCISAAAGHHITEGRWLRDQTPGRDLVNFWLAGPGTFPKPMTDGVNANTADWAHEYSFWAASALWQQFLVTGDAGFATGHLDNLVKYYEAYSNQLNTSLNLYWQAPVWDASEYTAASYETDPSDPYHGGIGYRPTINSYQYGDAMAISRLATIANNPSRSSTYVAKASALQSAQQKYLWDTNAQFFKHRARDNNPSGSLVSTREYMGYIPWMFNMPNVNNDGVVFAQLLDTAGFASPYGPLTAENRSAYFMKDAYSGCCRWDGPSWPFATSQVLTAAANFLNNYVKPSNLNFAPSDYYNLLKTYAGTQFLNGAPYVAEAHDPYANNFIYNSYNHSEDYNHSTFVENVIAELIGLRAQANNSLVVNPLVAPSITYFGLENAAYHGHNITVLWDQTGSHYNQGQGLQVWVDGTRTAGRSTLGPLTVTVGSVITQTSDGLVNIAANPLNFAAGPQAYASYTSPYGGDAPMHAIDGSVFREAIPENSRWTTYNSANPSDWWAVNFQRSQAVSNVRVSFYNDNQGVLLPTSYDLQYATTAGQSSSTVWTSVPNQARVGALAPNAEIRITFPQITAAQLRIVAPNRGNSVGWGISEFKVYTKAIFYIQNFNSQKLLAVQNASQNDGALIQQYSDNGSRDHLWQFEQVVGGWWKIRSVNSGKLLTVQGASTANSTNLVQMSDSTSAGAATDSQLWRIQDWNANGQFFILNKNSNLVAGVTGESQADSANVVQFANTGTPDHLWLLMPAVPLS